MRSPTNTLVVSLDSRVHDKLAGNISGIHSVEVSAHILLQLANFNGPTSLKNLSDRCKLSASKVHRYLSSLVKVGLVSQAEKSGNYSLGKKAILLGLAAMQHIDQIDEVMDGLPHLVKQLGCHVTLTVWSQTGPTLIKVERAESSVVVPLMLGQVLPILHSASGRIFAAFLEPSLTRKLMAKEKTIYADDNGQSEQELEVILQEIRQNRFAISRGEVESETTAIAVPVVDWQDNPIIVLAALIPKNSDKDKVLSTLTAIRTFADQKSVHKPSFPF